MRRLRRGFGRGLIQIDGAAIDIDLRLPIHRGRGDRRHPQCSGETKAANGARERVSNDHFVPLHWPDTAINTRMQESLATADNCGP